MIVSNELTHHRDMLPMILEEIGRGEPGAAAIVEASARSSDSPRPFVLSDALRPTTRRLAPFELFEIDGPVRNFSNWTAKGVFIRPGELAQPLKPIQTVSLAVSAGSDLSVGDPIELSAEVVGGEANRLYLFFHRTGNDEFEVIHGWSTEGRARWTVGPNHRNPCVLELLLAVRNELAPESEHVTVEKNLPLKGGTCG